jgi:hypothetical protein
MLRGFTTSVYKPFLVFCFPLKLKKNSFFFFFFFQKLYHICILGSLSPQTLAELAETISLAYCIMWGILKPFFPDHM